MASLSHAPKHVWIKEEEVTLVECLVELVPVVGWKSDNGTFQPEMHGPSCSGFGCNDEVKCIIAEKNLFDNWVKLRAIAKWPYVALRNDTTVRQEVLYQLRAMLELSRLERTRYSQILFRSLADMHGFLKMIDEEKMDFYTILLQEDS
ncbi:retrotransposon protein [Cucumis melo var. makuwa]|uniref:Retrotransposon protein n=1 Tax=Cucumis melo var. makuwa TaxID=1194695 RepID=A0A5A7TJP4_CUCMM|nr:retrotransposon protein [Cucumis melo var. makuwa]